MMKDTNADARRTFGIVIPGKVSDVVSFMMEDFETTPLEALMAFYSSTTYKRLESEKTKYWHWGAVSLYDDFLESTGRKTSVNKLEPDCSHKSTTHE